jgi:hypothetical protein
MRAGGRREQWLDSVGDEFGEAGNEDVERVRGRSSHAGLISRLAVSRNESLSHHPRDLDGRKTLSSTAADAAPLQLLCHSAQ